MRKTRDPATQYRGLPWRILICLALAAFLLRAAIPSGFMAAPSSSHIMLALCDGASTLSISLDLPGQSSDKHLPADACAFGALSAHAVLPDIGLAPVLTAMLAYAAPTAVLHRAAPALPPLGPPLGSRAPPVLLA